MVCVSYVQLEDIPIQLLFGTRVTGVIAQPAALASTALLWVQKVQLLVFHALQAHMRLVKLTLRNQIAWHVLWGCTRLTLALNACHVRLVHSQTSRVVQFARTARQDTIVQWRDLPNAQNALLQRTVLGRAIPSAPRA